METAWLSSNFRVLNLIAKLIERNNNKKSRHAENIRCFECIAYLGFLCNPRH